MSTCYHSARHTSTVLSAGSRQPVRQRGTTRLHCPNRQSASGQRSASTDKSLIRLALCSEFAQENNKLPVRLFVSNYYVSCVDVSHLSPMCPDSDWPLAPVLSEVEASGLWPLRLRRLSSMVQAAYFDSIAFTRNWSSAALRTFSGHLSSPISSHFAATGSVYFSSRVPAFSIDTSARRRNG